MKKEDEDLTFLSQRRVASQPGLLNWYNSLHQVTADMSKVNWSIQQPKQTLNEWAMKLKDIAQQMEQQAKKRRPK
jgi:hypothetical protein